MLTLGLRTRHRRGILACFAPCAVVLSILAWGTPAAALLRPPARFSTGAAFDQANRQLVIFGGWTTYAMGDTWVWNGAEWRLASTSGPLPRNGAAMAWDPVRGKVVLFGGDNHGSFYWDTWEWDGIR